MLMHARQRSSPFTASQWEELEHQALIFKYMINGMPIPSDLLYPLRRGLDSIFPPHPIGWGCFQMGFGRKADPEPGRCRRTDGKKWRCSKEAFPDSKYCDKHMHRGRNRSRKPVEMTTATADGTTNPPSAIPSPNSAKSTAFPSSFSSSMATENHHLSLLHPHPISSRPQGFAFSPQNNNTHFNLGTGSYSSAHRDYRYSHGLKEDVDEHSFFSEASGTLRGLEDSSFSSSWRSMPVRTSSLGQLKHKNCSVLPMSYSQLQLHNNLTDMPQKQQQQEEQHCFVLGADFKSDRPTKVKREEEPQQQPLHRFFDEWPLKSRDSWLDLEENPSNRASFSTTQLSISIPMASSEALTVNSRLRKDD